MEWNPFGLKKDNPSQANLQNQNIRSKESLIQGKIRIQHNWNEGLEYS